MPDLQTLGRLIFILGCVIALVGLLLMFGGRFFPWLGNLPGDIRLERGNSTFFFPLTSSIIISLILTLVLNIILRLIK